MFAYCLNNPVNCSDSSGTFAIELSFTAVAVGVGIVALATSIVRAASKAGELVAEQVKDVVREAIKTGGEKPKNNTQSVYVLVDSGGEVQYVGRTKDPGKRERQHKTDILHPERKKYEMIVVKTGMTIEQARLAEQTLISTYVIASGRVNGKLQGLDNSIRGIAVGKIKNFVGCYDKMVELYGTMVEDEFWNLLGR